MKKVFSILPGALVWFFIFDATPSQAQKAKQQNKKDPEVEIKVNKQLDKNGNVIRYDSTYAYSYSSVDSVLRDLNLDSLFQNFGQSLNFNGLNNFGFNDSISFNMEDFMNSFHSMDKNSLEESMNELKKQMELLNHYLKQNHFAVPRPSEKNDPHDKIPHPQKLDTLPEKNSDEKGRDM